MYHDLVSVWKDISKAKLKDVNLESNSRRLQIALNGVKHFVNNLQQYVSGRIESIDWINLERIMSNSPTITDVSKISTLYYSMLSSLDGFLSFENLTQLKM